MGTFHDLISLAGYDRWQDLVLSAGNVFFCFTLIPMLRHGDRPPLLTCIPTGLALLAGGCIFATLHLWFTAITQAITGLQWLALACKKRPAAASLDRPSRGSHMAWRNLTLAFTGAGAARFRRSLSSARFLPALNRRRAS
jgi:hypothetical protein